VIQKLPDEALLGRGAARLGLGTPSSYRRSICSTAAENRLCNVQNAGFPLSFAAASSGKAATSTSMYNAAAIPDSAARSISPRERCGRQLRPTVTQCGSGDRQGRTSCRD